MRHPFLLLLVAACGAGTETMAPQMSAESVEVAGEFAGDAPAAVDSREVSALVSSEAARPVPPPRSFQLVEPENVAPPSSRAAHGASAFADSGRLISRRRVPLRAFRSTQEVRRFGRRNQGLMMGAMGSAMGGLGGLSMSASSAPVSASTSTTSTSTSASTSPSATITNTQIAGIDEGDIVKAVGEHFVVLRRGVLYSASVGEELAVQDQIHVQLPDQGEGWIDELLVHQGTRTLIVTGFVSGPDGRDYTLYHLFTLEEDGRIVRGDALFFPSMDYFDEENYATRMVGDDLVTYSIHQFQGDYQLEPDELEGLGPEEAAEMRRQVRFDYGLPQVRRGESGRFEATWSARRIFREQGREASMLHAITSCRMTRAPVRCRTRAVVADGDATLFVSHSAAYLWMSDVSYVPEGLDADVSPDQPPASPLYRFPHGRSSVQSVAVTGETLGALSFRESAGSLQALVFVPESQVIEAEADEETEVELALLTIPLRTFGRPLHWRDYRPLPGAQPGSVRFIGEQYLLYGDGSTFVHNIETAETVVFDEVMPERIDPLGTEAALVSWNETDSLHYAIVDLDDTGHAREMRALNGATSSETRTHGFFFQPDAQGGSFGMPVVSRVNSSTHASVAYFDVRDYRTTLVGSLSAQERADEECENSCVDWYGNARPIFWGDKVFALLGSELVEGMRENSHITERTRVTLVPTPRSAEDD